MDATTESIAHFIGLFEIKIDEFRLRQDYLEFRLKEVTPDPDRPIEVIGVRLQAPHQLQPYDPGLAYDPVPLPAPPADLPHLSWGGEPAVPDVPGQPPLDLPDTDVPLPAASSFIMGVPVPIPASILSATIQIARLSDDDVFQAADTALFTNPTILHDALASAAHAAEALQGFVTSSLPLAGDWMSFASTVLAQIQEAEAPSCSAAEIWTFRGTETGGIHVNGLVVEEAPVWSEILPLYLRDDAPEAETEDGHAVSGGTGASASDGETVMTRIDGDLDAPASRNVEHDFSRDFAGRDESPSAIDPGLELVAGANSAINEIAVASQWIDAPVIVVSGDVARFDAISQVNVLVEHDTVNGEARQQDSVSLNAVEITTTSSHDGDEASGSGRPEAWSVVRVEADVIQVNWVKQFTFATDFDRADMVVSGHATYLGLGANEIVNAAALTEIGFGYDLIFVGGNMVDATVISQTNTLFDSDSIVTGAGLFDTEALSNTPTASGAKPVIDAQFESAEGAPDTAPASEGIDETLAPADPAMPAEAPSAQPPLSLADNLLLNQVTLTTTGIDSFAQMAENFAAAAEDLANGAETLAREVAQDAMFAGQEALRALQIDGDLIRINLFEQTNIVGDADQIRLEMEELQQTLGDQIQLIAGSNALMNIASITEHGVDSKIMAAGQVYDDALIHQAELIDTEAMPSGVTLAGLSSEAIAAFVSDSMLDVDHIIAEVVPTANFDASSHVDVMQSVLA